MDEPAYVFGDNQSVLANTNAPGSTLKKKSNTIESISYEKTAPVMSGERLTLTQTRMLPTF